MRTVPYCLMCDEHNGLETVRQPQVGLASMRNDNSDKKCREKEA